MIGAIQGKEVNVILTPPKRQHWARGQAANVTRKSLDAYALPLYVGILVVEDCVPLAVRETIFENLLLALMAYKRGGQTEMGMGEPSEPLKDIYVLLARKR